MVKNDVLYSKGSIFNDGNVEKEPRGNEWDISGTASYSHLSSTAKIDRRLKCMSKGKIASISNRMSSRQ